MIEMKSGRNQNRQGKTAADQQGNATHKTLCEDVNNYSKLEDVTRVGTVSR